MSLDEMLKDIKEGITPTTENITINNISLISSNTSTTNKYFIPQIDKETVNRINQLIHLIVYKENMNKMSKVDKSFAMEVFTMLPNVAEVDKAKLTTYPSSINKELLNRILDINLKENYDIFRDTVYKLKKNRFILEEVKETILKIREYLINFSGILEDMLKKYENDPIIVIDTSKTQDNKANLLTDPIAKICKLNDSMFMYDKFANNITRRYISIYEDNGLKYLLKKRNLKLDDVSIKDMLEVASGLLLTIVDEAESTIKYYLDMLDEVDKMEASSNLRPELLSIVNLNEEIISSIENINKLNEIISNKENVFNKIIDLLNFLKNC